MGLFPLDSFQAGVKCIFENYGNASGAARILGILDTCFSDVILVIIALLEGLNRLGAGALGDGIVPNHYHCGGDSGSGYGCALRRVINGVLLLAGGGF